MWYDLYRRCNRHGVSLIFRPSEYHFCGVEYGDEFEFIKGCYCRSVSVSLELYTSEELIDILHKQLDAFLEEIPEPRVRRSKRCT